LHRPHPLFRQIQFTVRRRLRRLEEGVEPDNRLVMDAKQQSGFLLSLQRHAQFVQAAAHGPTERHSERPTELNRAHRRAHFSPALFIELLEPFRTGSLPLAGCLQKTKGNGLIGTMYLIKYVRQQKSAFNAQAR
jgi:hypothetical protein